jgi:hypothetical protein
MSPDQPAVPATMTPAGMDPDRLLLVGVDTSKAPLFSIGELANCVFGMSTHWVRWRESAGHFDFDLPGPDGAPLTVRPGHRTPAGARQYTLTDAEMMVVGIASRGRITGQAAAARLSVVYDMARVWGYLAMPDGADTSIPEDDEVAP